ncbi:MAG: hypothetical protein ISS78_09330 [Phycisphaerae bacterium]|nr:hypothetical protein [Phycisphaerae bacterium]
MKGIGGSQAVVVIILVAMLAAAAYMVGWSWHSGKAFKWMDSSSRVREIEKAARELKLTQ